MPTNRSIYPKHFSLDKEDNPLQTTTEWIVKICSGITRKRTCPLMLEKLKEFFPYTSDGLFFKALGHAINNNLIKRKLVTNGRSYGYIVE